MSEAATDGIAVRAEDGHTWTLLHRVPEHPRASLLWLPAMGVAARHYLPLAEALSAQGIAVFLHEARGHGSSSLRASRTTNWGYREWLALDLPASEAAMRNALQGSRQLIGGHSLGGQLACCHAALHPARYAGLWLVASGTPHWPRFSAPRGWLLPAAYRFMAWLSRRNGALPGRRIGFGGNEARGLIDDWTRVGLSGRYAARGLSQDLEAAMARLALPVTGVLLAQDWLAPPASLAGLVDRFASPSISTTVLDAASLGTRADHFAWMRHPQAVVQHLAHPLD